MVSNHEVGGEWIRSHLLGLSTETELRSVFVRCLDCVTGVLEALGWEEVLFPKQNPFFKSGPEKEPLSCSGSDD